MNLSIDKINWLRVGLFNLALVALLGALMRYKAGFEFPHFNQKNLQHAHSHFAFSGWVSLMLMALMVQLLGARLTAQQRGIFNRLFALLLLLSYGMLVSFAIQGYGAFSIVFSTASILLAFYFCWYYYALSRRLPDVTSGHWFTAALVFNALSSLGTFFLSYMMASRSIDQHAYLASVYWYLHFQYNGWFFMACMGLFFHYFRSKGVAFQRERVVFRLMAGACLPAYGLSVLWLDLPLWIYALVVLAAVAQFIAWLMLLREYLETGKAATAAFSRVGRLLLLFVSIALTVKLSLQLGSTIPALSQFAFGFRPVVIAYLHLALLAVTTVFILAYLYWEGLLRFSKAAVAGLLVFASGIFLNELVLAVQGIASISYTVVPLANELLFAISLVMLSGLVLMNAGIRARWSQP